MELYTIFLVGLLSNVACCMNNNQLIENAYYAGWKVLLEPPYIKIKHIGNQYPTLWFNVKERTYSNQEKYRKAENIFLIEFNRTNNSTIVDLIELYAMNNKQNF